MWETAKEGKEEIVGEKQTVAPTKKSFVPLFVKGLSLVAYAHPFTPACHYWIL